MSTDTSVPQPRVPGLDASDSALFATLIKESPMGFAFFDSELRCRRVNDILAELLGVAVEDLVDHALAEALPEETAAAMAEHLAEVIRTDGAVTDKDLRFEAPARPKDPSGAAASQTESPCWSTSWFPSHNAEGEIIGIALIAVDVTERRLDEEQIRRKEERYRSLVEASSQIVWVTTPEGEASDDAPEWRAITGQSLEEYRAGGWLAVVHEEDRARVEAEWLQCLDDNRTFSISYRVRTRTGAFRQYEVRAVPIKRGPRVIEWVGANTDVTGQREADEMRGRLTEQLSAAALRTARLQQATSMLAEALTVGQVVSVITEVGRSAIGADRSSVALLDDDKLKLTVITPGSGQESEPPLTFGVSAATVMSVAVRESRPFLAGTPENLRRQLGSEEVENFLRTTEERAWVGLPLLMAGSAIGALRFAFTRPREITEEERVFLEALAGQCALALGRATLYEREHKTAEMLQRSLLPDTLPQVQDVQLAARYHPATRHVQVGGDWYDAFRLADDRLAIALGDVMGKGVLAASVMGRVRNALRALALNDPRPAAVMAGLDRVFTATEDEEQFTTLAYAVFNPESGSFVVSNAGHPPALVIRPDGPPILGLGEPGTPLGWPSQRQQASFSVEPGNTVVFYSDGLVENRRRGVDAGLDELVVVAENAPPEAVGDPEILVDYLVDQMLSGYDHDDDITVLALHVPARNSA